MKTPQASKNDLSGRPRLLARGEGRCGSSDPLGMSLNLHHFPMHALHQSSRYLAGLGRGVASPCVIPIAHLMASRYIF